MKIQHIIAGITLCLPTLGWTQTAPTLQELIESATHIDYNLQQQVLENKKTKLNDEKLKDLFLPKLEVSGKAGYLYSQSYFSTPQFSIPSLLNLTPVITVPEQNNRLDLSGISTMAKAEASMLLYSGGKVKYLQEANREKSLSEEAMMDKNRDEVITSISKAYDQFALVHQSKKVLDEAKKRLEINKNTAEKALGYGLITPYDYKKIELAQATLDSKIVEYEGKKRLLITQLNLLSGIEPERIEQINPQLVPIQYETTDENISQRAEIKALTHGIKATEYKIKAEERWWIPKVVAQSSLSYIGLYDNHLKTSKALIPNTNTTLNINPSNLNVLPLFQIGVGFRWEILDGNEGKHAVENAKIDREILESKKAEATRLLKLNLANNQSQYDIATAQIQLKRKAKEIAQKALDNVEKEFRYGTKKSSDLIDAENDLQSAELEYETAIFNQRRAAIELMKSTQNLNIENL